MFKKQIFICILLFVFGFTGIASATRMNYSLNSPRNPRLKVSYSSDEIGKILEKFKSWKPSHPGLVHRKIQQEWPIDNKMNILKKLIGKNSNKWQHLIKISKGRWLVHYKGCKPNHSNQVPEPATMLLLGFGLIAIAGFGRKKIRNKDKK